ncbi:DUF6194 family protein [Leifsonia sp. NPDC102414]|uniref:DUF6194 family protein n=1 Tax=Leifsonia sp. NPDC102414 TaxID=3364124 RepID=UPI00380F60E5
MEFQEIVDFVQSFDGSLVLLPDEHSGFPELSWGDAYFYFAPDGLIPERTQPYATIITKNYPDDHASRLDAPGRFRVNIHVGRDEAARLVSPAEVDPAETDAFFAHPLYGASGWVSVVNPGERTVDAVTTLLRVAHDAAAARASRRSVGR